MREETQHTTATITATMMMHCCQLLVLLLLAAYNFFAAKAALLHHVAHPSKKVCCQNHQPTKLHDAVTPLSELECTCYESLLNEIPTSAQIVLIGEGTHGTEDFFRIRCELTKHLIQRRGFNVVICEGDVQPFFQLCKLSPSDNIRKSLHDIFEPHFPDWMWNNNPMAEFVSWMHTSSMQQQLMGMDIQSPFVSIDFITEQLDEMDDKKLVTLAKECYATLNRFRPNIRRYGDEVYANRVPSQAIAVQEVVNALSEIYAHMHDSKAFELLQNAYAVVASEAYHRQRVFPGHTAAWNTRTRAFLECILRSRDYISRRSKQRGFNQESGPAKLIVWAHNSHVGDMRSTGYAALGQVSLGQLCREMFMKEGVFLIGMTTYEGTVRAAQADRKGACWKGNGEVLVLKEGLEDSHEAHLHELTRNMKWESGEAVFGMNLQETDNNIVSPFDCDRLERFVGSCYLPHTELMSHYTQCNMVNQFDYIFHVDISSAIAV